MVSSGGWWRLADKNYYDVLGVPEDASKDIIKKEYRKLAVKYHPDKGISDSDERMKEINEAYTVLSNDDKRSRYDMERKYGSMEGTAGGFHDVFNDIFGGMRRQRRDPNAPMRGQDINYLLELPLRFFIFGGDYSFKLKYRDMCKACSGTGAEEKDTCGSCGGSGQQTHRQQQGNNVFINTVPCASCGGRGFTVKKKCEVCEDGGVIVEKEVTVWIPKNIRDGHIIKQTGQGFSGKNNGPSGDLYIKIDMILPSEDLMTDEQKAVINSI